MDTGCLGHMKKTNNHEFCSLPVIWMKFKMLSPECHSNQARCLFLYSKDKLGKT